MENLYSCNIRSENYEKDSKEFDYDVNSDDYINVCRM